MIDGETSVDALPSPRARRCRRHSCWSRGADQRRALHDRKSARHPVIPVSQRRRGSGRRGLGGDAANSVAGTREATSRRGDVVLVRAPRDAQLYRLSRQDVEDPGSKAGHDCKHDFGFLSAQSVESVSDILLPGIDLSRTGTMHARPVDSIAHSVLFSVIGAICTIALSYERMVKRLNRGQDKKRKKRKNYGV